MNKEEIRAYCLSKKGVSESLPFNDTALVFKVGNRMFALLDLSENSRGLTLKCDPLLAVELRDQYFWVTPAFHFNKKHWNTIETDSNLDEKLIKEWIDHSYRITASGLTKKLKQDLDLEEI